MSLLSIRDLTVSIHGKKILKSISLDIERGEIHGLIGESGSGKSMTAFSTLQLLPQGAHCEGEIILDGKQVLAASEAELCAMRGSDVGMVFQEPMTALNPVQTIGQQVSETIRIHAPTTSAAQVRKMTEDALRRAELPPEKFPLSRYPFELSGGQRQRVVIAMAIALQPKLLIADESTTALDVTTQAQILDLLKRLAREDDMALLLITHDLAVVADMADRITIMRHGEVLETAPADRLFRELKHPYTRALFEASSHQPEKESIPQELPLLQVRNVIRDYPAARKSLFGKAGHFRALHGISFDLMRGENLGLVGESGCGKSTLTRAILGLDRITSGEVLLDGQPVSENAKTLRRKMQVVFQDPYDSFNPRHKVSRLVSEPFHLDPDAPKGAALRDAIGEALVSVGLKPEDADKYVHEFSGGQRQRIAIARALILKPELILLDEAVSALDVSIRAQILDLLADLSDRFGLSYLFISHDLSVVRAITDRVLVMQAGRIVEQGPTADVFENPQHDYTRRLIEAAPTLPKGPEYAS